MESSPDWSRNHQKLRPSSHDTNSNAATDSSNHSPGYSIVHSPPFTFLVGPSHTKLTIQSGLACHVSKPLDHLMNSGLTRESKHHIAVLEEEDVETFVAFCEYAYTGDYSVPPPGSREDDRCDDVSPFKGMFSNPFGSGVPPPAPSPPQSVRFFDKDELEHEGPKSEGKEELPQIEKREEANDGNNDVEDRPVAPDELPQDPGPAPTLDEPSVQPPATPADEGDSWGVGEETAPSKGKKGKKGKKDKKKQKGGAPVEEPTSNLTPPTTPPPENPKDKIDSGPAPETFAVKEEPIQVTEPVETVAVEDAVGIPEPTTTVEPLDLPAPPMDAERWEPAGESIPPEIRDGPSAEGKQEDGIKEEQRIKQEVVSPRSQMKPFIDTSFAKQHFPLRRPTGVGLWDEFAAIDYVDHRSMYRARPLTPVSAPSVSSESDLPYLVFHAKLYVFAVRYLIPVLAQLCLRKLHADLLNLSFPGPQVDDDEDEERVALTITKARMVLDLLHYTYTKTTRLEPISQTSATQLRDNELRKLVVHYAACKVHDLARYCPPVESMLNSPLASPVDQRPVKADRPSSRGFRALLDSTTELASDLVYRMM